MFSLNPYTRRRQQLATSLTTISGVAMVLLLLQGVSTPPPTTDALPAMPQASPDLASFGRVALAPGGARQVELIGTQVRLRERATQRLIAVQEVPNAQSLRFSPDGKEVWVRSLQLKAAVQGSLPTLSDRIVSLSPTTGKVLTP